jgi:hypothetical protein
MEASGELCDPYIDPSLPEQDCQANPDQNQKRHGRHLEQTQLAEMAKDQPGSVGMRQQNT